MTTAAMPTQDLANPNSMILLVETEGGAVIATRDGNEVKVRNITQEERCRVLEHFKALSAHVGGRIRLVRLT